jgi:hypothetical protein
LTARGHFERGALIAVVFLNGAALPLALRCMRVRWGQALEPGRCKVGGRFIRELSDAELKSLLRGGVLPGVHAAP